MCRSVEIATLFVVPLRRTDGHSKKRRYEETKLPMRSAAAGLWPAYRKSKNGKYKQLAILCCLYLPFLRLPDARSAWRRTRCRRPAGGVAPAGLLVMGSSSLLRFFAVNRGYVSARQ